MVPETSRPGISDAPGGGGYLPRRWNTSGRLTPAAATLMSTSPAAGTGFGRSTGTSTSGSPGSRISIAITVLPSVYSVAFAGCLCRPARPAPPDPPDPPALFLTSVAAEGSSGSGRLEDDRRQHDAEREAQ